jgi:Ni,Fe-hydrogenase maturation factor
VKILVGGVGELYQGDLDAGRHLVDRLVGRVADHVVVEELHYGAIAVSQMLEESRPDALVLTAAMARSARAGSVRRRAAGTGGAPEPDVAQQAILQAAVGYVDVDLIVTVCAALGTLPSRTVVVEIEPETTGGPTETLSASVAAALGDAEAVIRRELELLPVVVLADRIRESLADGHLTPAPALDALEEVLAGIDVLHADGRWTTVFRSRDRLRLRIATDGTGEGMDHLDWGLWWSLVEELDRLERRDVSPAG